ncbi:MAG: sugar phosphate isomerase/epimerase family protein, partial [Anaerolineae bacterium]
MKLAVTLITPEVVHPVPVALFTGTFAERLEKAASCGYEGVELMVQAPAELDAGAIASAIREAGLEAAAIGTGAQFLVDRLTLVSAEAEIERRTFERFCALVDFASAIGAPLITIGSFRGRLGEAGKG